MITALVLPVQFYGDVHTNEYWWMYKDVTSEHFGSREESHRNFLRYMETQLGLTHLSLLTQEF